MSYAFDMPHGRELFQSRFLDRRCAAAPSVAVSPPDFDRSPRIEPDHGKTTEIEDEIEGSARIRPCPPHAPANAQCESGGGTRVLRSLR